jgi:hypothetical protein
LKGGRRDLRMLVGEGRRFEPGGKVGEADLDIPRRSTWCRNQLRQLQCGRDNEAEYLVTIGHALRA